MARKKRPILVRMWHLLALLLVGKVKSTAKAAPLVTTVNTTSAKLLLLRKRLRPLRSRRHRLSYAYFGKCDHEFSPSSTPPFAWSRSPPHGNDKKTRLLCLLCCGGAGGRSTVERVEEAEMEDGLFSEEAEDEEEEEEEQDKEGVEGWVEEEEEDVDRRAERFIERFYEEMELQRQRSDVQYMEMLERSC